MSHIQFGNSKIEYTIVKSKRRKTIGLVVSHEGILVRSPTNISSNKLKQAVRSKAKWIKTKQFLIQEAKLSKTRNDNKIQYLGKYYDLKIRKTKVNEKILFKNGKFTAFVNATTSQNVEKLYNLWLKTRAMKVFENRVSKYKKLVGVNPSKILIKDQKTRWGSATKKSSLNFNWNILKAPIKVIDYVVVHELCHLRIHNHSTSFWKLVGAIMPDYESRKEWLRINGLSFID